MITFISSSAFANFADSSFNIAAALIPLNLFATTVIPYPDLHTNIPELHSLFCIASATFFAYIG